MICAHEDVQLAYPLYCDQPVSLMLVSLPHSNHCSHSEARTGFLAYCAAYAIHCGSRNFVLCDWKISFKKREDEYDWMFKKLTKKGKKRGKISSFSRHKIVEKMGDVQENDRSINYLEWNSSPACCIRPAMLMEYHCNGHLSSHQMNDNHSTVTLIYRNVDTFVANLNSNCPHPIFEWKAIVFYYRPIPALFQFPIWNRWKFFHSLSICQ